MADIPKITTGEWRTSRDSLTGAVWAGEEFIASVYPNAPEGWDGLSEYPRIDEMRANARLIAAAPELLGALRFILAFYEPGQTYLDTNAWKQAEASARRAVAKAEGRE